MPGEGAPSTMGGWLEATKGILPDYVVYGFPLGKAKGSNQEA